MAVDAAAVQSYLSNALLFMLIAGMAGSCDARLFAVKFKKPNGMLAALFSQFVLLPAIGFLSVNLFPQSAVTVVTLLVVTTSPGGGFSGFWCYLSNADLALSVAMTTASTMFCIIALPMNIAIYISTLYKGTHVEIDYANLLLACVVVICAVITGYNVSKAFPRSRQVVSFCGQTAGVALMIFGALANGSSSKPVWGNPPDWFFATCSPVFFGLTGALFIAMRLDLPNPQAVAVAIECCYQNTGLALTIALSAMPPEDVGEASGVPLVYGLAEVCVIPIFAIAAWRLGWTYAPRDENVCIALGTSYQPTTERDSAGGYSRKVAERSSSSRARSLRQLH